MLKLGVHANAINLRFFFECHCFRWVNFSKDFDLYTDLQIMSMNIQSLRLQSSVLQPLSHAQAASVEKTQSVRQEMQVDNVFSPAEVVSRLTRELRSSESQVRPDRVAYGREVAGKNGYPSENIIKEVAVSLLGGGDTGAA